MGMRVKGYKGSVCSGEMQNCSSDGCKYLWLYKKATELYTLKRWIVWYVNCISLKVLKKKKAFHGHTSEANTSSSVLILAIKYCHTGS